MRKAHREAAKALYEERNSHLTAAPVRNEADDEIYVDLHGLHPEEAIEYLENVLLSHSNKDRQVLYAITGTGESLSIIIAVNQLTYPSHQGTIRRTGRTKWEKELEIGCTNGGTHIENLVCLESGADMSVEFWVLMLPLTGTNRLRARKVYHLQQREARSRC